MTEEELEPKLKEAPINLSKTSTADLKAMKLTSENSDTVTKEMLRRDKMVMLKLQSTERDKGGQFVCLNGRSYMIPRDVWVKVPSAIVSVLEEAKITHYSVMADPSKGDSAKIESQETARFGMSTKPVEEPAPAAATKPATAPAK